MAHNYSFALITIFLLITDRWVDQIITKNTILLGLLIGLISLIRPTNIIIVLLLILWKITTVEEFKNRVVILLKNWRHVLLMVTMFIIVWIPQFVYWKTIAGSFFYFSYPADQGSFSTTRSFSTTFFVAQRMADLHAGDGLFDDRDGAALPRQGSSFSGRCSSTFWQHGTLPLRGGTGGMVAVSASGHTLIPTAFSPSVWPDFLPGHFSKKWL